MNKKWIFVILGVLVIGSIGYLFFSGAIELETVGADETTPLSVVSVSDLEDGCYYVWHNENETDIGKDLMGTVGADVFRLCPSGDINWSKNAFINHTIWFTSANDKDIPTLYPGDELLYISSVYVPYEGISWERFGDYGYTIGVANMEGDTSGHYRITNSGENGYTGYIYEMSDAYVLEKYVNVSEIFLDKVGSVKVRENLISAGGTVFGLEKDEKYVCEWYTGTYYQDYKMQANIHAFCSMETFTTYEYEFLHSNCIAITIPEWLKTGYYYLDGIGFFRYLSAADAEIYNGKAYDPQIDWNDPIIIYDENGFVKYNPTVDDGPSMEINTNTNSIIIETDNVPIQEGQEVDKNTFGDSDGGAEEYEYIYNEIIIP